MDLVMVINARSKFIRALGRFAIVKLINYNRNAVIYQIFIDIPIFVY